MNETIDNIAHYTKHIHQARAFLNAGQLSDAENVLMTILQSEPNDYDANVLLAFSTYLKGDYNAAETKAATLIKQQPLNAEAYLIRGYALQQLERLDEALKVLQRALTIAPDCLEVYTMIAKLLLGQRKMEEAVQYLNNAKRYGLTDNDINQLFVLENKQETSKASSVTKEKLVWVNPRDLLHPARLDIIAKHLYARELFAKPTMNSALNYEDLYLKHIYFRTGGVEPGDEKRKGSLESFQQQFKMLLAQMMKNQFDPSYPIPVARSTGLILNGAHRIAAALLLGIQSIPVVYHDDVPGLTWDADWFIDHGFSPIETEELVRTWMMLKGDRAACIMLWPSVQSHWDTLESEIADSTAIVYRKSITLSRHAFNEFVRDVYATDWGPIVGENIEKKINYFQQYDSCVRFLVVSLPATMSTLADMKKCTRKKWHHVVPEDYFATLHTTDKLHETQYIANIMLNRHSLNAIQHRPMPMYRQQFLDWLLEYHAALQSLYIHPNDSCIVGSAVLEAYGVREATDVDFTLTHDLRAKYFTPGVTHLTKNLDVVSKDYPRSLLSKYKAPNDNDLIRDQALHIYVRGLKFARLDVVVTRKQMQQRDKDKVDVRLVSRFKNDGRLT